MRYIRSGVESGATLESGGERFGKERSRVMWRFADLLEDHNDQIASLETWDNGKPYEQAAKVEVPMLVRLFRYYAGRWNAKTYNI